MGIEDKEYIDATPSEKVEIITAILWTLLLYQIQADRTIKIMTHFQRIQYKNIIT